MNPSAGPGSIILIPQISEGGSTPAVRPSDAMPPIEAAFFMEEAPMAFSSVTALEGLVNQSLGKADTPSVQQGISVGGLVLQGVLAASMSKLAEHIDITAFDAALTKTLAGATELERVIAAGPAVQPAMEAPAQ